MVVYLKANQEIRVATSLSLAPFPWMILWGDSQIRIVSAKGVKETTVGEEIRRGRPANAKIAEEEIKNAKDKKKSS